MAEIPWSGPLAPMEVATGDGRRFAANSLTNRELPLPLQAVFQSSFGHNGATTVGRIDTIVYGENGAPSGTGVFFDTDDPGMTEEMRASVQNAVFLSRQGVIGPSVDLDDVTDSFVDAETGEPVDPELLWMPPDGLAADEEPVKIVMQVDEGRICSATLVSIPAFAELMTQWTVGGEPVDQQAQEDGMPDSVTAAAKVNDGFDSMTIADQTTPWADSDAEMAVRTWAGIPTDGKPEDPIDAAAADKYAQAFLYQQAEAAEPGEDTPAGGPPAAAPARTAAAPPAGDGPTPPAGDAAPPAGGTTMADLDDFLLQVATVLDGNTDLTIVPKAVDAAAKLVDAGATGPLEGVDDADLAKLKTTIEGIYAREAEQFNDPTLKAPWDTAAAPADKPAGGAPAGGGSTAPAKPNAAGATGLEALAASGAAHTFRSAWFACPNLREATPLTVTADGQVYGHLATWNVCHVGVGDACITAPQSEHDYAYFHVGEVDTEDGPLAVGKITLGGGHADPKLGYRAAAEHYDDAGTCVAAVRAGQDDYGVWVAGQLLPGVTDQQVTQLKLTPLSGDWRRVGGSLELVAALAVVTPGFPVLRTREVGGRVASLVAAAVVPRPKKVDPTLQEIVAAARAEDRRLARRAARLSALAGQVAAARRQRAAAALERLAGQRR
jgi:hypothetical protein